MTTLILGCGYLGLQAARLLREVDPASRVIGTTRSPERFREIAETGARPHLLDVFDPDSLASLPEVDAIIHCAAYGRSSPDRPARAMDGLLVHLDRRDWRGRMVHVSTTSVYGQADGSWVDEGSRTEPTTEAGRAALEAEVRLRATRPSAVTIRMAGLYGRGRMIGRTGLLRGDPVAGDPDRWLNLIRIEDAARVVVAAMTSEAPAVLYLACDNRPIKRREYYGALADSLGLPAPVFADRVGVDLEPDKRIRNRAMREGLGVVPEFPDITAGLRGLPRG